MPTTIGDLRPADVAAVAGLIRPAIEAAAELAAQGQTLSRDTSSDWLREAGYAMSNARASALVKVVRAASSPGGDGPATVSAEVPASTLSAS